MSYVFNPFTRNLDFTGSGGSSVAGVLQYKARQVPTPAPDGSTVTFTLPDSTFESGSLSVYLNGVEEQNLTEVAPNQFTLTVAPFVGEIISASYAILGTATSSNYGAGLYGTATYT